MVGATLEGPEPSPPPIRRSMLRTLAVVAAATAFVWSIAALSVLLFSRGAGAPRTQELVIPAGAAREVERGENPLAIPPSLSFVDGDVLVLRNEDEVTHVVGPYRLPPGGSARLVLRPSAAGSFLCTIHPSGALSFDVRPRGLDVRLTLLPTLLLGPPLGAIVALIRRVVSRLDVG